MSKINIRTDSDFTVKSVGEWLPRWLSNGWKTNTNQEVKNKDMFKVLHEIIVQMEKVTMVKKIHYILYLFFLQMSFFSFRLMFLPIKEYLVMKRLIN